MKTATTSHGDRAQFDRSCDDALAWISRFRGGNAREDDHRDFALWLAADARNRRALDLMLELWDDLGCVRHLPFDDPIEEPVDRGRRRWLAGAGALAASAVMAALLWPSVPPAPDTQLLQTGLGERRETILVDGSRIVLNTNSRVSVHYRGDERSVELLRGEAYFDVRPDAKRPFSVTSGNFRVTALGTAFNIRRLPDDSSDITVTEGVVRVSRRDGRGIQPPSLVNASERVQAGTSGLSRVREADPQVHIAWQRGELVARAMPVAEVLQELSRYHALRVVPGDHEIARLTVSGVFMLDHPDSVLRALERSLNLRTEAVGSHTLRLLKAEQ